MAGNYPLEDLFQEYKGGALDKRQFEGRIFQYLLENAHDHGIKCDDRNGRIDYLSWLYPRISRAIDRYEEAGSSFDAYIGVMTRFAFKEYKFRQLDHHRTEHICWDEKARDYSTRKNTDCDYDDDYENEDENVPCEFVADHDEGDTYSAFRKDRHTFSNPHQMLILLLKSYYHLTDDLVSRAASAIGIGAEEVDCFIEQLRNMRHNQHEEINRLEATIHTAYYRRMAIEQRLTSMCPGTSRYIKLSETLERTIEKQHMLRARLATKCLVPSNRQIAEVLGVPKGTIDANWHAFKVFAVKGKQKRGRKKLPETARERRRRIGAAAIPANSVPEEP